MQGSKRFLVSILCASLLISSCSTLRDVPLPAQVDATHLPELKPGDHVVVRHRTGAVDRFRVTALDADGIRGAKLSVPWSEVSGIEVSRFSGWRSAAVVTGVVVAVVAAAIYAVALSDLNSD